MNSILSFFVAILAVAISSARPSYVAIPLGNFMSEAYGQPMVQNHGYPQQMLQSSPYNPVAQGSAFHQVYLTTDGQVIPDQAFDGTVPVPSYLPAPAANTAPVAAYLPGSGGLAPAGSERVPRGSGHHYGDLVDYGAYTGGHGAFGWYSDHPVHHY